MDRIIYSKTARGMREAADKTKDLSRDLRRVLKAIDGKADLPALLRMLNGYSEKTLTQAIETLVANDFIRALESAAAPAANKPTASPDKSTASPSAPAADQGEELDFTSWRGPSAEAAEKAQAEEQQRQAAAEQAKREAEARLKAETAAQARMEAEAKARREAEEASARAEAEIKARVEAEAAARRKAAEEQALREAEEKARREAEEAKARAEAERLRLAAENERLRQETERLRLEAERKAREAEERARQEAAIRAQREAEEARLREAAERLRIEAELKEKAAAEEKARQQAEEQARREAEERARQEADAAKARAEKERQVREAAEARARQEAAIRAQCEAEEARLREAAERLRIEAEYKEKAAAEEKARQQAEEQARREAEERARQEAAAHAQREAEVAQARAEAERRAQEAATKAREEAAAHARREAEEQARRAAEAAVHAEAESERQRLEAEASARQAAEEQRQLEDAAAAAERHAQALAIEEASAATATGGTSGARRDKRNTRRNYVRVAVAVAAVALVVLHLVPFDGRLTALEQVASAQFGQPVKAAGLNFWLFPPQWRMKDVRIGDKQQIHVALVKASTSPLALFGDAPIGALKLTDVQLDGEGLAWVLLGKGQTQEQAVAKTGRLGFTRVAARDVQVRSAFGGTPPFDAEVTMDANGRWQDIKLTGAERKFNAELKATGEGVDVKLDAAAYQPPLTLVGETPQAVGPLLKNFNANGRLSARGFDIADFSGEFRDGYLAGKARLTWETEWRLTGEVRAKALDTTILFPGMSDGGMLGGKANFTMRGVAPATLALDGDFTIEHGALKGVDLSRLLRGAGAGSRTSYDSLSGQFSYRDGKTRLSNVVMDAGQLTARGAAEATADKRLSGRFEIQLKSPSMTARSGMTITGTMDNPRFGN